MVRGALEFIEFKPRQVAVDAGSDSHTRKRIETWNSLLLERRALSSSTAALASITAHLLLVAPVLWAGGGRQQHPPERKFADHTAMQWVILDDSSEVKPATPVAAVTPTLDAIRFSETLPAIQVMVEAADPLADKSVSEAHSSLGAMYGRYVGQIQARIERAWQRPRIAIGAPIFQCQVQIDQDPRGRVGDVTLLQCNGDIHWRLSLVHAIESASPLPAPPNPAVFTSHVLLRFRAMRYTRDAPAGLYQPAGDAPGLKVEQAGPQSQSVFEALREAANAPHAHRVIELRIEGSKADIEPEHQ